MTGTPSLDRLYDLLPTIHRQRDEALGGPLRDLLSVIAEQVNVVEADIQQLYENWFVETCDDWVVPYLGDLVGYQPVNEAGEPGTTPQDRVRNKILIPRREVARTIQSRRRRGTLALLEELARDTAGWPARAVEFFRLVAFTQSLNHQQLTRGRTVDLRDMNALALLDSAFDTTAHTIDVRRRHNLPNVALYVFRLRTYPATQWQCACLEEDGLPNAYTFSFSGNDMPLYARVEPETDPNHIADETNLPVPIRRLALQRELERFYGAGKSLQLWRGVTTTDEQGHDVITHVPIPAAEIVVSDLSQWESYRPPEGKVAVDPALGRILFHPADVPAGVWASFYYGFSAGMGGGEYERPLKHPSLLSRVAPADFKNLPSLAAQLKTPASPLNLYLSGRLTAETRKLLQEGDAKLEAALVKELNQELANEKLYDEKRFDAEKLDAEGKHLLAQLHLRQITSAQLSRLNRLLLEQAYPAELATFYRFYQVGAKLPLKTIEAALQVWRTAKPRNAIIEIADNGVYSDPLNITLERGQSLQIRAAQKCRPIIYLHEQYKNRAEWLSVNSKTGGCFMLDGLLVTGRSMRIEGAVEDVRLRHCTFVPGWGLTAHCDPKRPSKPSLELHKTNCRLTIAHSIVGSIQVYKNEVTSDPIEISIRDSILDATSNEREALGAPNWPRAHVRLCIARSTVIGQVQTHDIALAEDSIFTGLITTTRRQAGCVRFCYVPEGSRTPRRFHCQPELAVAAVSEPLQAAERLRVTPQFTSVRYGTPAYGQLALSCAREITRGASDESEMGAFHDLFQPQRAANLRTRLPEFMPAGMEADIIFAS